MFSVCIFRIMHICEGARFCLWAAQFAKLNALDYMEIMFALAKKLSLSLYSACRDAGYRRKKKTTYGFGQTHAGV